MAKEAVSKNLKTINDYLKDNVTGFSKIHRPLGHSKGNWSLFEVKIGKESTRIRFKGDMVSMYDEIAEEGIEKFLIKYDEHSSAHGSNANQAEVDENVDINEQFEAIEAFADMVIDPNCNTKSLVVSGPGGIGKTYAIFDYLESKNIEYKLVKGYSSPRALFDILSQYRDKVIVFDDCDSIWEDRPSLNLLKSALETNRKGKRIVSWNTADSVEEDEFEFNGSIIFVSNKDFYATSKGTQKHVFAVLTRVLFVQVTFRQDQILKRIEKIAEKLESRVDVRTKILDFLKSNAKAKMSIRMFEFLVATFNKHGEVKFPVLAKELLRAGKLG